MANKKLEEVVIKTIAALANHYASNQGAPP
jgi:hypothetical protein